MRILQVTPRYAPHTGGVETHVEEISRRLVDRGHDVTVHTADARGDLADRAVLDGGVTVERHRGFAPGGAFHVAPGIMPAVRRSDADVIHAHNYHSLPVAFAALGRGDARFVVTTHYHGASADEFRDRLLSLYEPVGRWTLERADQVVAVSDWERRQLRADFGVDATVIPNGLDVERFRNAAPREHDRPYLLCVGRLEEYKGIQHAIRALPELPEYDLLVAGSGPYRDELERVAGRIGVRDRVEFLGYVDDDDLPGLYAGADVYLTLSSFESYGMTVAEALAAGTPCVVSSSGALEDWLDNSGVVSTPLSGPEAVRESIETARDLSPDSTQIASWQGVVDELQAEYRPTPDRQPG